MHPSHKPAQSKAETDQFDYVAAARAILPRLAATSDESERLRRLDDDAAAALRELGLCLSGYAQVTLSSARSTAAQIPYSDELVHKGDHSHAPIA